MALVNAKCTNCGGTLEVDNTKDALICSHCGSPFITEKAINNYNTTHNHFTTNVYNMYGGNSADFVIRGGVLEKYNGASTKVKIPNTVTHIRGAFKDCSGLISVEIPNSVQEIGQNAFSGCKNLTSIIIPNSVKEIGLFAFSGCTSLTSIVIPNSVKEIGPDSFSGCTSLTSINIPNSVQEIGIGAFSGCTSLTSIVFPNSIKEIGWHAFSGCASLKSVTIPDSVCNLNADAFENCPNLFNVQFSRINEFRNTFPAYFTLRDSRISRNKCTYCGGNFKLISLLHVTCKNCGRRKDY